MRRGLVWSSGENRFIGRGGKEVATAEQIKALLRSHFSKNEEKFISIALQLASHEARKGHYDVAQEIRDLVDEEKLKTKNIIKFPNELTDLIYTTNIRVPIEALVVKQNLKEKVKRIAHEYKQRNKLKSYGLEHRRKVLLTGPPGTGKTMTAKVIATELKIPLQTVQMDRLVTKFMGETSAKLRQIFDQIEEVAGVYFFDEFDAIGGERSLGNDVGEMRRVLNSFLYFIENCKTDNIVIAATNNKNLLDQALFRRFDDILLYELPSQEERKSLIRNLLGTFYKKQFSLEKAAEKGKGLSHADVDNACRDAVKEAILENKDRVTLKALSYYLEERKFSINERE